MHGETISYTIDIGANIEKVKRAMREISNEMDNSNLDSKITAQYERKLGRLRNAVADLESKAGLPLKSNADVSSLENSLKTVDRLINQLGIDFKELSGKDLSKSFGDFLKPIRELKKYTDAVLDAIDALNRFKLSQEAQRETYRKLITEQEQKITDTRSKRNAISESENLRRNLIRGYIKDFLRAEDALAKKNRSYTADLEGALAVIGDLELAKKVLDFEKLSKAVSDSDKAVADFKNTYKHLFKDGKLTETDKDNGVDVDALRQQYQELLKSQEELRKIFQDAYGGTNIQQEVDRYKQAAEDISTIQKLIQLNENDILLKRRLREKLEEDVKNNPTIEEYDAQIAALEALREKLKKSLDGITGVSVESEQKIKTSFENLRNAFAKITGDKSFEGLEYTKENFEKIRKAAEDFSAGRTNEAIEQLRSLGIVFKDLGGSTAGIKDKIDPAFDALGRAKEASSDFDHLTSRLKYFFSLAGGFNLMRRAIRSAVTTTKELDAVMTLTAVVSLYSVKDMWKTLPQYSKEAQKLGVAIKDVYSAQTLYVQLGLDMNSAMQIGVETMKMARVANIGAEEATNSMTAALRGFNMELTERSAKRVNDVYSKLAQNTASNTQEISTAMTKTAALANSANMSFENTSAFLATIIESTREGAETAGTALKTVIARFTEVKKLYSKGELTSTDEEGLEVNVNKISAALRTAGINMNDFFTGAKGLDEIFMELGSRWDSLTTVQLRYIATMAAGSRQQSRFLALMQNYNRTLELSNMAYNSAGSGQEQFDKTLESLDAKLARLKDAWATFVMGIANSDAIKGIVDAGTWILNTINNIIEKISGGNGLVKAVLSIGTAFATFKVGGALLKGTLGSLSKSFIFNKKQEKEIAGGFFGRMAYRKVQIKKNFLNVKLGFKEPLFSLLPWKRKGKERRQTIIENEEKASENVAKAQKQYDSATRGLTRVQNAKVGPDKKFKTQEEKDAKIKGQQEKVDKKKEKLDKAKEKEGKSIELAVGQLDAYAAALGAVAVAAGVAAGVLGYFASKAEEAGNKRLSAGLSGISAGLGALSVGAGLASSAMTAMASAVSVGAMQASTAVAAIPFIGWALVAVTAITAITVAILKYHKTAKEKLEDSKKALEEQLAHLTDIKNKVSEINETLGKINDQEEALKNMAEGTLEWDTAVKSLNESILEFGKNFPEFKDAIEFDTQTGRLTLNQEKVEEKLKELKELVEAAQGGVTALEASTAYYDFNYKRSKLARKNRLSDSDAKALSSLLKSSLEPGGNGIGKYTSADFDEWAKQARDINISPEDASKIYEVLESLKPFFEGDENYSLGMSQLERFINGEKLPGATNLKRILKRTSEFYQLAGMYGEYETKIEALGRLTGQTYIAENSRYNGIINRVALRAGEKEFSRKMGGQPLTDYEGNDEKEKKEDEDKWVELWLKSLGATDYKRTNGWNFGYKDAEGKLAAANYSEVKTQVLQFKLEQLAEEALQKVIEDFWGEFADINHKLISGKGTYSEYIAAHVASEPNSVEEAVMKEFLAEFYEARKKLSKIMFGDESKRLSDSFGKLGLFLTENIADFASTLLKKFGKELAESFLSAIDKYLGSDIEDISTVTDSLIYVLSLVESGAISNLEEFTEALWKYGIEGFEFDGIEAFFKRPKGFEKAQENLKSNLALWNTARSSTVFSEEDRNKLLGAGMKRGDFILTSLGYVSTKPTATSKIVKNKMIGDVESEIGFLSNLITALTTFNGNTLKDHGKNRLGYDLGTINEVLKNGNIEDYIKNGTGLFGPNKGERYKRVRYVLEALTGGKVYNLYTGGFEDLEKIDDEDLAGYLQYYLDNVGNILSLIGQRGSLQLELDEIKDSKLLNLAPAVQSAIIDIITLATENGIDIRGEDIDLFKKARNMFGSEKQYTDFLTSFSQLDWNEISNIKDFRLLLKKLGIEFDDTTTYAKDLFDTLKGIYGLGIGLLEKIDRKTSTIESGKEIIKAIADGNRLITTDQYRTLLSFLGDDFNPDDWTKTGADTYTFMGDTNSLLASIDRHVAVIGGDIKKEAAKDVQVWDDFNSRTKEAYNGKIFDSSWFLQDYDQIFTPDLTVDQIKKRIGWFKDFLDFAGIESEYLTTLELYLKARDFILTYFGENGEKYEENKKAAEGGSTEVLSLYVGYDKLLGLLYGDTYGGTSTEAEKDAARKSLEAAWVNADDATKFRYDSIIEGLGGEDIVSPETKDSIKALLMDTTELEKKFSECKDDLGAAIKEVDSAKNDPKKWADGMAKVQKIIERIFKIKLTPEQLKNGGYDIIKKWWEGKPGSDKELWNFFAGVGKDSLKGTIDGKDVDGQALIDKLDDVLGEMKTDAEGNPIPITFTADTSPLMVQGEEARDFMNALAATMGAALEWEAVPYTGPDGTKLYNYYLKSVGQADFTGGGGGGGGGGGKKFKNDFDKYYNQVEDINELERQRNLLEKDYQLLLKSLSKSGVEIYQNLKKQLELLEERKKLVADLAEKRKGLLFDVMQDKEYKKVWKYAKWNDEDQTIEIDWDAINKIKNSKEGDLVKEYIKKLEEYLKMYDELIDALEDIEDTVQEIKERGREEYQSLEDRTRDALIKQIQDKIDELTDVNESINNTNQKLFDKISETLELQRQDRENKKTEEELSDKEKRLAYLRQDSSNANLVEIAQLEKELEEAREDYTDTLIDLKISELQRQNDEAAEQRDHLIELMEKSLDWLEKSGAFWNKVYALISLGTDETGSLIHSSELADILKSAEGWEGLSEIGKMQWLQELLGLVASGFAYLGMSRQIEDVGVQAGTEITFTNGRGETLTGTVADNGDVLVTGEDGTVSSYSNVFLDYMGNYTTGETEGEVAHLVDEWKSDALYHWKEVMFRGRAVQRVQMGPHEWTAKSTRVASGLYKWTCTVCGHEEITSKRKAKPETGTQEEADTFMAAETGIIDLEDEINAISRAQEEDALTEEEKKKRYKNAKGGLHTHTGPTWIDGTWSKPELILSSRDTENFIELKDTLTSLKSSGGLNLGGGENYYDIDIQVDSLGSDYDVDRMVDRIKARIAQDNAYRNVNTLSRLR